MSVPIASIPLDKSASPTRPHLHFLDGIRGLAALFVAFGHISGMVGCPEPRSLATAVVFGAYRFAGLAHAMVCAFIVLSGFCLMLPVANSTDGRLAGGFAGFFRRRSRRILPPYYAALIVGFLLPNLRVIVGDLFKGKHFPIGGDWSAGDIASHLLLVHNLSHRWYVAWDGPTWTVATEWQIYFLFALLLLPLWRRFGMAACFAGALLVGLLPHFALPRVGNLDWAAPWLLGLFAIGMFGALTAVSPGETWARLRARAPWGAVAIVSAIVVYPFYVLLQDRDAARYYWFMDFFAAIPILSLILWCSNAAARESGERPAVLKLLESRWAQAIGAFSYSLYLVHFPIEQLLDSFVHMRFAHSLGLYFAVMLGLGLPMAIGGSYVFHLLFERPFFRSNRLRP